MTASHLCVCACCVHICTCHCVSVDEHVNTQLYQTHTKGLKPAPWVFTGTFSFNNQSTSDTHLFFSHLHLSSLALYPSFMTSSASPLLWGNPELSAPGVRALVLPFPSLQAILPPPAFLRTWRGEQTRTPGFTGHKTGFLLVFLWVLKAKTCFSRSQTWPYPF